jgi:hypothetical protein
MEFKEYAEMPQQRAEASQSKQLPPFGKNPCIQKRLEAYVVGN